MPSYDIVSEVNSMEIENAVNQAKKELATRFDFKGSKAAIAFDRAKATLTLSLKSESWVIAERASSAAYSRKRPVLGLFVSSSLASRLRAASDSSERKPPVPARSPRRAAPTTRC